MSSLHFPSRLALVTWIGFATFPLVTHSLQVVSLTLLKLSRSNLDRRPLAWAISQPPIPTQTMSHQVFNLTPNRPTLGRIQVFNSESSLVFRIYLTTQQSLDLPSPFPQVHSPPSLSSAIGSFAINTRYSFSCYSPVLAVTPSPTSSTSSPAPTSHSKSNKAAIVGGIVGAVALVLFALALLLVFLRKRRKSHLGAAIKSHIIESGPNAYSGLTITQPGLSSSSVPLFPSLGGL